MAHFFVRNSLNTEKSVKIDLSFARYVDGPAVDGDLKWVLEIGTTHPSISGTRIRPVIVNNVENYKNVDAVIAEAVSIIASQIDWDPLVADTEAPFVGSVLPEINAQVPIESNVYIDIKDNYPSSGLDLSEMVVTINNGVIDFDITDECTVTGDPFHYTVHWKPPQRNYKYYN